MEKRRKVRRRVVRIALIALAAYAVLFLSCTKVTHVDFFSKDPGNFLWVSRHESCNTVGYYIFYPGIKLLESTQHFRFLRPLPPGMNTIEGTPMALYLLDVLWP